MVGAAITSAVAGVAGATIAGVGSYQQGQSAQAASAAQAAAIERQSEMQAREIERKAAVSDYQAGVAQMSGDIEAEHRSATLASDIGSTYANAAGNGLLVDSPSGTVADVLRTQTRNAAADISRIRDDTAMNVWNYQMQAAQARKQAGIVRMGGVNDAAATITEGNASYGKSQNESLGYGLRVVGAASEGTLSSIRAYRESRQAT